MPALKQPSQTKKEKVTISVDASLLQMVDSFVHSSKDTSISRSSVVEEGLHLWKQQIRDSFDEKYYSENAGALADPGWTAIASEAAKYLWRD